MKFVTQNNFMQQEPKSFLTDMKDIFIPSIATMLQKEKVHLELLKETQKVQGGVLVNLFIQRTNERIEHFEIRLKEYTEFLQNGIKELI